MSCGSGSASWHGAGRPSVFDMARYTFILVSTVMRLLYHTFLWNLPKAILAFASLAFASSSMTFLDKVLPR